MRQLTSLDAQFLAIETPRTVGHVSGLAVLDPVDHAERDAGGRRPVPPGLPSACRCCRRCAGSCVRCRSASTTPTGSRTPTSISTSTSASWRSRPTPTTHKLAEQVARIVARPLDRSRPLWELYLIHGLPGGRVAMLTKIHHAVVDGVSGAEILSALLDLSAEGRDDVPTEPTGHLGERVPSDLEMLGRAAANLPLPAAAGAAGRAAHPPLPAAMPGTRDIPGFGTLSRRRPRA